MTKRDPLVFIGLAVVIIAAAVSSFGALDGTARLAGWSPRMAALLPVVVDATAAVATRIWLCADTTTDAARRYARAVALGAIGVSLVGNTVDHLAAAGYLRPGVWLVIAVGGAAPVALAVVAHLAVLHALPGQRAGAAPALPQSEEVPVPAVVPVAVPAPAAPAPAAVVRVPAPVGQMAVPKPQPATRRQPTDSRTWDELVSAARTVDSRTRQATGRAAGVGKIKAELAVGQARAQMLRDHLAALPQPVVHANGHDLVQAAG